MYLDLEIAPNVATSHVRTRTPVHTHNQISVQNVFNVFNYLTTVAETASRI